MEKKERKRGLRRVWALLLTFALTIGMLPLNTVTVWAEETAGTETNGGEGETGGAESGDSNENTTGFVVTADMNWEGDNAPTVDENANYSKAIDWLEYGDEYYLSIGIKSAEGDFTAITDVSGITFTKTDSGETGSTVTANLVLAKNKLVKISFPETGTYTATYGESGTITLTVSEPKVAFYSEASAAIDSLIGNGAMQPYKKGSGTVYLKLANEWSLADTPFLIDNDENKTADNYITYTPSDNGIGTITINENAPATDFELKVYAADTEGNTKEWNINFKCVGMLVATDSINWQEDGSGVVADDPEYRTSFDGIQLNYFSLALGFRGEDGNATLLDSLNEDNLSLTTQDGGEVRDATIEVRNAIVYLIFAKEGNYTLTYTNGDTSGSIAIEMVLPFAGFYSSETGEETNYIADGGVREFSADNKTIYFLVKDGYKVSDVAFTVNDAPADEYVTISEPDASGKRTITVNDTMQEAAFDLVVSYHITTPTDTNGWNEVRSIRFVDSADRLMSAEVYDDGTIRTDEKDGAYFTSHVDWMELGGNEIALVYGKQTDPTKFTRLVASDLTLTTEDGGEVSADTATISAGDNGKIKFTFKKAGTYKLTYQGSSMTLDVSLPRAGFFTAAETSEDTWIDPDDESGYVYNGSNQTVYFVYNTDAEAGDVISDVTFKIDDGEGNKDEFFTVSGGNGCYTITLKDELPYREFELAAEYTQTPKEGDPWNDRRGIMVRDKSPRLMAGEWGEDCRLDISQGVSTWIGWLQPGINGVLIVYGPRGAEAADEVEILKADDLYVTDMDGNAVTTVTVATGTGDLVELTCEECGLYQLHSRSKGASIGMRVSYPKIGFYTGATMSKETLLWNDTTFLCTENAKDLYLLYHNEGETFGEPTFEIKKEVAGQKDLTTVDSDGSTFFTIEKTGDGRYHLTVKEDAPAGEFYVCATCTLTADIGTFTQQCWLWISNPLFSVKTSIETEQTVDVPVPEEMKPDDIIKGTVPEVKTDEELKLLMDLAPVSAVSKPSEEQTEDEKKITNAVAAIDTQIQAAQEAVAGEKKPEVKAKEFIDISLSYTVTKKNAEQAGKKTAITETKEKLEITVELPAKLQVATPQNKKIQYSVYRYHDNKAERLENTVYDPLTNLLTFFTDKFSVYAIVAEEVETEQTVTPPSGGNTGGNTGGGSSIGGGGTVTVPDQPTDKPADKPADQPTDKPAVGKGDVLTSGKASYKVTETADGKQTVSYMGTTSTAKKLTIPAKVTIDGVTYKVTAIAKNAFKGNKTVQTVVIASGIKEIGTSAFAGCTKLTSVKLPKTITTIGASAFKDCKKLTSIVIPKSVKSIGKNAFANDKNLKKITIQSVKLNAIGKNAFKGIHKKAVIKVPKAKKKAYTKLIQKSGYKGTVK